MEIQMEKEKELKKLAELEGHTIKRCHVPDYIDLKFAKEKQIYDDDEIGDKKTDDMTRKKGKGKSPKKKIKKIKKKKKTKVKKTKVMIKKRRKRSRKYFFYFLFFHRVTIIE